MFYPSLYENCGGTPLYCAQRELRTRTHYVDDGSLKFHKARVLSCHVTDGGLLLTIMESVGLDWDNTRRGYRYVTFDLFGNVVSRVALEDCWKSREPARKAMWAFLNAANAVEINLEAARRYREGMTRALDDLDEKLTARDLAA